MKMKVGRCKNSIKIYGDEDSFITSEWSNFLHDNENYQGSVLCHSSQSLATKGNTKLWTRLFSPSCKIESRIAVLLLSSASAVIVLCKIVLVSK